MAQGQRQAEAKNTYTRINDFLTVHQSMFTLLTTICCAEGIGKKLHGKFLLDTIKMYCLDCLMFKND